ncbi:MAG: ribosome biogenesis GTPase YlqF [Clostridiales bacterium]|nr:ribosome biogenesis GTPase YlqF [Clostridiales bacterium]
MKINWFPGHMKKTMAEIKSKLVNIDVVIYLLDSRAPISSINPSLSKLSQNKPVLYVFNKVDIADEKRVEEIAKDYKSENSDYIIMNSTLSGGAKLMKQKILALAKDKIEKFLKKGIKTVIRAIVIGVPNSGKSTLVNNLCGKAKAVTGNRAGVTKMTQWVSIGDNIEICDTPGTLYPNLEDQEIAKKLLFVGSIKDEVVADTVELAQELISQIREKYPSLLQNRYGEDLTLEGIAKKRGFILGKGEYDIERSANAVIDDFRKCRIGKITLD